MNYDCSKCDAHFECNATAACRCENESVMTITDEQLKRILLVLHNGCPACPCTDYCNGLGSCFVFIKGWLEANS